MIFNSLVYLWLGKSRLVLFIMSISTITYDIDEDIFSEFLTILDCDSHTFIQNIRYFTIYMDNWSI